MFTGWDGTGGEFCTSHCVQLSRSLCRDIGFIHSWGTSVVKPQRAFSLLQVLTPCPWEVVEQRLRILKQVRCWCGKLLPALKNWVPWAECLSLLRPNSVTYKMVTVSVPSSPRAVEKIKCGGLCDVFWIIPNIVIPSTKARIVSSEGKETIRWEAEWGQRGGPCLPHGPVWCNGLGFAFCFFFFF